MSDYPPDSTYAKMTEAQILAERASLKALIERIYAPMRAEHEAEWARLRAEHAAFYADHLAKVRASLAKYRY